MARIARQDLKSSVFSIKQNTEKNIFRDKADRKVFVDIIIDSKDKFDFDIYGYCLLDDDSFWLVINTKHRSISAIMQSITISYARYRNDETQLFSRRYKSKPLYSFDDVEAIVDSIKKDERYIDKNFCFYNPDIKEPWPFISNVTKEIEIREGKALGLSANELEKVILSCDGERNDIIRLVYQNHNVTQKQLADYFELSKSSISKILK